MLEQLKSNINGFIYVARNKTIISISCILADL